MPQLEALWKALGWVRFAVREVTGGLENDQFIEVSWENHRNWESVIIFPSQKIISLVNFPELKQFLSSSWLHPWPGGIPNQPNRQGAIGLPFLSDDFTPND